MTESRWARWSTGTLRQGRSLSTFTEEVGQSSAAVEAARRGLTHAGYGYYKDRTGQVVAQSRDGRLVMLAQETDTPATVDMGNPTSAESGMTPADKARSMGFVSDGNGSYKDAEGNTVARTVNNELVFYDSRGGGGAVSDGSGGAQLTQSSPSWVDPETGLIVVPPAQPESPEEVNAVPDPTPATAPAGYDAFVNRRKREIYKQNYQERQIEADIAQKEQELDELYDSTAESAEFRVMMNMKIDQMTDEELKGQATQRMEENAQLYVDLLQNVPERFHPEILKRMESDVFDLTIDAEQSKDELEAINDAFSPETRQNLDDHFGDEAPEFKDAFDRIIDKNLGPDKEFSVPKYQRMRSLVDEVLDLDVAEVEQELSEVEPEDRDEAGDKMVKRMIQANKNNYEQERKIDRELDDLKTKSTDLRNARAFREVNKTLPDKIQSEWMREGLQDQYSKPIYQRRKGFAQEYEKKIDEMSKNEDIINTLIKNADPAYKQEMKEQALNNPSDIDYLKTLSNLTKDNKKIENDFRKLENESNKLAKKFEDKLTNNEAIGRRYDGLESVFDEAIENMEEGFDLETKIEDYRFISADDSISDAERDKLLDDIKNEIESAYEKRRNIYEDFISAFDDAEKQYKSNDAESIQQALDSFPDDVMGGMDDNTREIIQSQLKNAKSYEEFNKMHPGLNLTYPQDENDAQKKDLVDWARSGTIQLANRLRELDDKYELNLVNDQYMDLKKMYAPQTDYTDERDNLSSIAYDLSYDDYHGHRDTEYGKRTNQNINEYLKTLANDGIGASRLNRFNRSALEDRMLSKYSQLSGKEHYDPETLGGEFNYYDLHRDVEQLSKQNPKELGKFLNAYNHVRELIDGDDPVMTPDEAAQKIDELVKMPKREFEREIKKLEDEHGSLSGIGQYSTQVVGQDGTKFEGQHVDYGLNASKVSEELLSNDEFKQELEAYGIDPNTVHTQQYIEWDNKQDTDPQKTQDSYRKLTGKEPKGEEFEKFSDKVAALDARRIWKHDILPTLSVGTVVMNTPVGGPDGVRARLYSKMGFGRDTDNGQYGIVTKKKGKKVVMPLFKTEGQEGGVSLAPQGVKESFISRTILNSLYKLDQRYIMEQKTSKSLKDYFTKEYSDVLDTNEVLEILQVLEEDNDE